jgi:hypothetical protein
MTDPAATYELITAPTVLPMVAIRCLLCGSVSVNASDVAHKYCGRCHLFHDLVADCRRDVARGSGHDCYEWETARHHCALCDRDLREPRHVTAMQAAARGEPMVGAVAVARQTTGVCDAGEDGVCYEVYTLDGRPGYSFIFASGRYDGFSPDDVALCLTLTGEVCLDLLMNYQFTNVLQLQRDFERGVFDRALRRRRLR